jgi:divalent metal cation (Fe/Co/Zn/Cd) transporter
MASSAIQRERSVARGIRLEYLTIGWNVLECLIAVISGIIAGSVALVGFGIDSAIESATGVVLLWRLREEQNGKNSEELEQRALKLVGVGFLLLAVYVAIEAVTTLIKTEIPRPSVVGIALSILSLIVMPLLARAKRKTASQLGSPALQADSRQTSICAYLSAILLGGLLLNSVTHWWWADAIAAIAMVPIIVREGFEALRGKACTDCH